MIYLNNWNKNKIVTENSISNKIVLQNWGWNYDILKYTQAKKESKLNVKLAEERA